jgi:hypothetical protein
MVCSNIDPCVARKQHMSLLLTDHRQSRGDIIGRIDGMNLDCMAHSASQLSVQCMLQWIANKAQLAQAEPSKLFCCLPRCKAPL